MFSFLYDLFFFFNLETGFGDDKWLLLYRHQGYSFQVELTIIHGHSIRPISCVCTKPADTLRAHHLKITKHPAKRLERVRKGLFPGCFFVVVVFQKGEDGSGPRRRTHSICHGFASHYQQNKLWGSNYRGKLNSGGFSVSKYLTCCPVSSISPFISMTKKKKILQTGR